ncbi:HTH domain-containing protein [Natronococcus pandeyae]|uniref:HTH domain-containing protein n=1 Tax=Natronococcus pandeyae TaxID=2055836 RepID=UPI001F1C84E6|nr:HTH domain-containing protein [Natronococcus pandeyae]
MSSSSHVHPTDLTVACHVRAPLLLDPVDSQLEALRRCEENGRIDSLRLQSWPGEVSLESDSPKQEVSNRFERFEQWAASHNVSVRPPFRVKTVTSLVDDEPERVLVTPALCLALYHGDQLVGVYPHSDGESTYTATAVIADLEAGTVPPPVERSSTPASNASTEDATAAFSPDRRRSADRERVAPASCPNCDSVLVDVHGIPACNACQWSDGGLDALESSGAKLVYLSLADGSKSIDALRAVLDLEKGALYGLLRTLRERNLVERTAAGEYRLPRDELSGDARPHRQYGTQ